METKHKIGLNRLNSPFVYLIGIAVLFGSELVHAQTNIFVENNTSYELNVSNTVVSGDKLNKKAWKQGVMQVLPGQRKSVLKINRSGKLNWMDPTPRFIEPGKTVVFSTSLSIEGMAQVDYIVLRQKLFGEGKTSRLWHSIKTSDEKLEWANDEEQYRVIWQSNNMKEISLIYRAYSEDGKTNIEYVFSDKQ